MEKLYMVPFNTVSLPDDTFTSDGLNFSANEPFLLISNKPIPKNKKVYFEFTISSYTPNKNRKNLPIYAGIHKEPSFGVLNSDFCIGSLYYNAGDNYKVMEKHIGDSDIRDVSTVYTRLPGSTDAIGVAIDSYNNTITFYVNGKIFYSFSPTLFNMNNDGGGNFYVCLWSNISCDLIGSVNFGKTYTSYLPTGFMNLYSYYYKQVQLYYDIESDVVVASKGTKILSDITGNLSVVNSIAGDRQFSLISKASNVNILSNTSATMLSKTTNNYLYNGANIFLNRAIPTNAKIYFEISIKNASNLSNIVGIPFSIGIANITSSILSMSIRIPLYHTQWHHYTFTEVRNLIPTDYVIEDVDTSIPNEEGKIIGIAIDLANNSMTIFINRIEFYTLKTVNNNFNSLKFLSYFFIHDEGAFTGTGNITFNYGATSFIGTIPDGYTSLYNYYNASYIESIYSDISCDLYHPAKLTKEVFIYGDITVDYASTTASNSFTNLGINKLMNTYNTISDTEQPMTADRDITFLNNIVNEMAYYRVAITQTPHQTILVSCGGKNYIDSFYTSYNTQYTVTLKHEKGYQPGILNTKSGYITSDIDIYATGAIKFNHIYTGDIECDISAGIHVQDWDIDSDILLSSTMYYSDIESDLILSGATETPGDISGDVTLLNDPINFDLSSDFDIAHTFFIRFINVADLTLVMRDIEQNLLDGDVDVPYQTVQYFMLSDLIVKSFDINITETVATSPTFTRNSQATNDDGTTVVTNVPRFSSNGLKIEEGTVNLVKYPNPTSLAQYDRGYGNVAYNNGAYFQDNSVPRYAYLNRTMASIVGDSYYLSVLIKMDDSSTPIPYPGATSGDFSLITDNNAGVFITDSVTLVGNGVYKIIAHYIASTISISPVGICKYTGQSSKGFTIIGNWQLEHKNYPTSFVAGTRTAEQLTIPANALNPQQGEIQFDWTPINQPFTDMTMLTKKPEIFQIGEYYANNSITLWHSPNSTTSDNINLDIKGSSSSGWSGARGAIGTYTLNSKFRLAVDWKNSNTFCLSINGIEVISEFTITDAITSLQNLVFGGTVNGPVNQCISNLRISNTFHTATQRLSDASLPILPVELDTTYYAPLQKDLSAVYAVPNLQEIISDITLLNDPINKDLPSDITLDRWTFNNDITCDLTLSSEPAYFYNGAEEYDGTITYDT